MSIQRLENNINKLSDKLKKSGKVDAGNYFENLLKRIKNTKNKNDKQQALQEIISSGKLADLANFSYEEDQLFDLVYEEAKALV